MEESNTNLESLQREMNNALGLIERSEVVKGYSKILEPQEPSVSETSSLLERCKDTVESFTNKPVLRLLHHFACSGGTLISKCIAAQPNVYLLSELHPFSELWKPKSPVPFTPTDILQQARYANIPKYNTAALEVFVQSFISLEAHLSSLGANLVVRLHTHSEFCVGDHCPTTDTVLSALEEYFDVLNVVTLRDPIDSYYSLELNNWKDFSPPTFDEYCRRLLVFIKQHANESIFFYEDFVNSPDEEINNMLARFKIPYNDVYHEIFDVFRLSGDSGRTGGKISPRPRREMPDEYLREVAKSCHYEEYKEFIGLKID